MNYLTIADGNKCSKRQVAKGGGKGSYWISNSDQKSVTANGMDGVGMSTPGFSSVAGDYSYCLSLTEREDRKIPHVYADDAWNSSSPLRKRTTTLKGDIRYDIEYKEWNGYNSEEDKTERHAKHATATEKIVERDDPADFESEHHYGMSGRTELLAETITYDFKWGKRVDGEYYDNSDGGFRYTPSPMEPVGLDTSMFRQAYWDSAGVDDPGLPNNGEQATPGVNYTAPEVASDFGKPQDGFWYGLKAGGKGYLNGLAKAGAGAISLGFWDVNGPFRLNEAELRYGAGISQGIGEVTGSVAATCGAGKLSDGVKAGVKAYDIIAGGRGAVDMYYNGPSVSNVTQMVAGGAGAISAGVSKCFTEGTQIVVGAEYDKNDVFVQYVTVNIENVEVGDLVYSYDTVTGVVSLNEVTETIVLTSDHILYVTVQDECGREQTLETTDSHPFWVVTDNPDLERQARDAVDENGTLLYHENIAPGTNGFWVEAKDLREGDVFLDANGKLSVCTQTERVEFPNGITVYNFKVEGNHDYFVIAQTDEFGQTCVLVHNARICEQSGWGNLVDHAPMDEDKALDM